MKTTIKSLQAELITASIFILLGIGIYIAYLLNAFNYIN